MNIDHNNTDYGLYIDHKRSFIITLNHGIHEELLDEITELKEGHVVGSQLTNQQLHVQNKKNEAIKKFCKAIIAKIQHPRRILIFGPAEIKFELRREIEENKTLKHTSEETIATDFMEKDEAIRYATKYFHSKL